MAGYIGSKIAVTQVDGYNRTEADAEFVNDPNAVITVSGSNVGIGMTPTGGLSIRPSGTGSEDTHFGYGANLDAYITTGSNGNVIFREGDGAGVTTERMRIDNAGRVTMPYQPAFFARPSGGYSLPGETQVTSGWSTSGGYNVGNHFNTSTGIFTAPIAGKYHFSWSALVSTNDTRLDFFITVNGNQVVRSEISGYSSVQTNRSGAVDAVLNLAANDAVGFWIANFGGSPREIYTSVVPWSRACGILIG